MHEDTREQTKRFRATQFYEDQHYLDCSCAT